MLYLHRAPRSDQLNDSPVQPMNPISLMTTGVC